MSKNNFRKMKPAFWRSNSAYDTANTRAALKVLFVSTTAKCVELLVRPISSIVQAAARVQNRLQSRSHYSKFVGERTSLTPARYVLEVASSGEAGSGLRSYYDDFFDRDQLARAINVNGDWDDPQITDLVRRAAGSPTADGQRLRCMIDDELGLESQQACPSLTASRSATPTSALASPQLTAPATSRPGNPFGTCTNLDTSSLTFAGTGSDGIYDPFNMVWIATPPRPAGKANPFSTDR
jgi:hypothetical protein